MVTVIERAVSRLYSEVVLDKAVKILIDGGLVAFPTETVYGLGANAYDKNAAKKIYEAKGRPSDNPLILHVSGLEMLAEVCEDEPSEACKILAKTFWPGPLTLVMKKSDAIPHEVTGGLDTVAVRIPDNKIALALIERCGFPIAAPSANSSGKPSPTRASHVAFDLSGKIDMIIDGGATVHGIESTIVDITGDVPVILRPGVITEEDVQNALNTAVKRDDISYAADGKPPKAPGMKYRHYSPKADLTIVKGSSRAVAERVAEMVKNVEKDGKKAGVLVTDEVRHLYGEGHIVSVGSSADMREIAKNLFKALRKFDFYEMDVIFSVSFEEKGLGIAVMNRLLKAAGGRMLNV